MCQACTPTISCKRALCARRAHPQSVASGNYVPGVHTHNQLQAGIMCQACTPTIICKQALCARRAHLARGEYVPGVRAHPQSFVSRHYVRMRRAEVGGGARMCSYSSCASRCYAGGSGAKQLQSWRLNLFEQLKKCCVCAYAHTQLTRVVSVSHLSYVNNVFNQANQAHTPTQSLVDDIQLGNVPRVKHHHGKVCWYTQ